MEVLCTRPGCQRPLNYFVELDDNRILKTVQQKFCTTCGMELILAGRYLPIKLLAKGGFGTAFLARDRHTPAMQECLVKQFQPAGNLSLKQLEIAQSLFEREAVVLEQLGKKNPQIPYLLAFFELTVSSSIPEGKNTFFYLVQEFIDGKNLAEELIEKRVFSESEVVEVLEEILKVLDFVHSQGSIHRDIKPANIIRGNNGLLYLVDFGAVKQATQAQMSGVSGQSTTSTGIYSLGFAPPEQMQGGQIYPATDLYALAVTCVYLLTGKPTTELFDSYRNKWHWQDYAKVSDRLTKILNKMLQNAPNLRYSSATEVLALLRESPQPSTILNSSTSLPISKSISAQSIFVRGELLGKVVFTCFEGILLAIAAAIIMGKTGISYLVWLFVIAGFIWSEYRGWLKVADLIIINCITLVLVLLVPDLRMAIRNFINAQNIVVGILLIGVFAGLMAIGVTLIWRLISNLFSRLL
ncbi:MAG: serine/threonine-protein kinase [Microcoleaceae cyanobacterium MO_207.B10]|nr:serine/threonine-protein kinase [Microcoleaceae cyanobacterium MO_207.B10]